MIASILIAALAALTVADEQVLLFSYFTGNGEDGLHLATSTDGYTWTPLNDGKALLAPKLGRETLMRDPCIARGPDGLFHMVWTTSWQDNGIGYANSPDLLNWSEQRFLPVMAHEPEVRNCWAPEIFWDEAERQWLLFWSSTIPGKFPETAETGDDGYNHRIYLSTTKDFLEFTPTQLFYNDGFNAIDATIVRDGERYVMFIKDETRHPPKKNIRIASSEHATGPYGPASAPITGDYWAEGPTIVKVGETWHLYFDKYVLNAFGALISDDLQSWRDVSEKISFPEGTRHGTVFHAPRAALAPVLLENR